MSTERPLFRSERLKALAEAGIVGPAADLVLNRTAGERHEWRVTATLTAVREAVGPANRAGQYLTLLADLIGIGGHQGLGGWSAATDRHPSLAELAKVSSCRRQAGDGGSWMAAAWSAIHRIEPDVWSVRLSVHDENIVMDHVGGPLDGSRWQGGVDVAAWPAIWLRPIVGRSLMATIEPAHMGSLADIHVRLDDTVEVSWTVDPESGRTWAELYNRILRGSPPTGE